MIALMKTIITASRLYLDSTSCHFMDKLCFYVRDFLVPVDFIRAMCCSFYDAYMTFSYSDDISYDNVWHVSKWIENNAQMKMHTFLLCGYEWLLEKYSQSDRSVCTLPACWGSNPGHIRHTRYPCWLVLHTTWRLWRVADVNTCGHVQHWLCKKIY